MLSPSSATLKLVVKIWLKLKNDKINQIKIPEKKKKIQKDYKSLKFLIENYVCKTKQSQINGVWGIETVGTIPPNLIDKKIWSEIDNLRTEFNNSVG